MSVFDLSSIKPSRENLLVLLRKRITDDVILEMAGFDVPWETSANREVLTKIRDTAAVPGALPWNPAEVCNLLRWGDRFPNDRTPVIQLFGCWILVCAYVQSESINSAMVDDGDEHTVACFAESALSLGSDYCLPASEFLLWAYLELLNNPQHRHEKRPYYLFGLLTVLACCDNLETVHEFSALMETLQTEERRVREDILTDPFGYVDCEDPSFALWLVGLAGANLNNFQERFRKLAERAEEIERAKGKKAEAEIFREILTRWAIVPR